MRIAIASGKGGTGKTTVAVNLASVIEEPVLLIDCDVEEPNTQLFLHPVIEQETPVEVMVPVVEPGRCTGCGACARLCAFNAIAVFQQKPLVFAELCHGCGGCVKVCEFLALKEGRRPIGTISTGHAGPIQYAQGRLNVGEMMATPLIRQLKRQTTFEGVTLLDAPPGIACAAIETMKQCDYVLLVTEPTPFGLHDLKLTVEALKPLGLRAGIIINRSDKWDATVEQYCAGEGLPIVGRIPDARRIAACYARGDLLTLTFPDIRSLFIELWESIKGQCCVDLPAGEEVSCHE
jgi:MinD superfamily P-loop ATPase